MFTAYVVVAGLLATLCTFSATTDFVRYEKVAEGMASVGVPTSWMTMLGAFKLAGALGLLAGVVFPPLGAAAAVGIILFFVLAILTHLRARDVSPSLGLAVVFLSMAVAALTLRVAA